MIASRAVRLARSFVLAGLFAGPALAAPALVVDVDSGKVLYAEQATDPWYPASITKLMTTYVALDMVRSGRASMDQLLTMSPDAAAQPPSKMGFKPGTQLTLDNALKIIMVKSANDIAWTIGENLGGSIEGFAAMMNDTARRLGMRESVWANPNGLPDDRQHTSARDMAILGRALLREFPDRRDLFSISAIQFGRRVMANHNGLLGRYPGVDGMKTGFICASGFNVVASATRDGRRLITVVMGSPNARERTLKAADLFDRGFSFTSWGGQSLDDLAPAAVSEPRNMRPIVCERHKPEPEEGAEQASVNPLLGAAAATAANTFAAPSSALAFAGMSSAAWQNRALPPRAPLQPVLVWIGRDPAESAVAANDAVETGPRRRGKLAKAKAGGAREAKKVASRARVDAAMAAVQAAPAPSPSIMEGAGRAAPVNPGAIAAAPAVARPKAVANPAVKHGAITPKAAASAARKATPAGGAQASAARPAPAAPKVASAQAISPKRPVAAAHPAPGPGAAAPAKASVKPAAAKKPQAVAGSAKPALPAKAAPKAPRPAAAAAE